jgi:hypothetical protein
VAGALQILLIVAGLVVVLLLAAFRSYWQALFDEFGRNHAARLRAWLRGRKEHGASGNGAATTVPVAIPGGRSLDEVASPAVVVVGTDAHRMASGRHAWVVDPTDDGDLVARVETAIDEAAEAVRAGTASTIAVILSVPLSGSWPGDVTLDLGRLFAGIFKHEDCPIWLAYEEPIDASPWPEQVFIETPESPDALTDRLIAAGLGELAASRPVAIGRSLRLSRDLAARALFLLASEEGYAGSTPSVLPASSARPNYASFIALGVRAGGVGSGTDRDLTVATEVQRGMLDREIRLTAIAPSAVAGLLPLTPYRGQVVAWRSAVKARSEPLAAQLRPPPPAETQGVADLEQALADGDSGRAAQTLATFGRAWIETPEAAQHLDLLERVRNRFGESSEPALWARYFVALDAALRRSEPEASWFDEHACELADNHGPLGLLFRAERMEFTRLRGDVAKAVSFASELAQQLDGPVTREGVAGVYASATARFVLGNVLRAGGRFDLARRYIAVARDAYDTVYPSHAVEAMHCRYALAVCDAVDGLPHVEQLDGVPEGQLVFARSLVTLANSQAAWFVNDLDRAIQFANEAGRGFRSIGYERHANRAELAAALFELWTTLSESRMPRPPEQPLIRDVVESLHVTAEPLDLLHLRPLAALAVLHFAVTFLLDATARRDILLPAMIQPNTEHHLDFVQSPPAASPAEANSYLRQVLGVGRDRQVPLLPD